MCCIVVLPTAVETASRGRSLGKLALGLRVVRDDGGAIGFRHAFIRALTGVVEIYLTFGGLAVLVGFLNPSSKRLGDLLAGTHAQVERVPRVPSTAFGVPRRARRLGGDADVARLPDALARRVAAFFANADHLVPESRARVAASLAAEVAPFVSPLPDAPPERFLAGVVALRRDARPHGARPRGRAHGRASRRCSRRKPGRGFPDDASTVARDAASRAASVARQYR